MEETKSETLDLSRRGLKKLEKAPPEEFKTVINLILDQNELQRLDNIDTYYRVENLSICNNFLLRMHGVSRLTNIRVLALNNNGILQIEGLKDLIYLKVLKLAGNNIKSIEHLNHNMHLEHLDLSNNQISFIADISYLKSLKHLSLERNRIIDLRQCDRYLPSNLEHLGLAHNNIQDLNEMCHLVHLGKLETFTIQGNPCVAMAGKDKLGFDYRPFILNWIMSVKSIDGFVVSAIESLKAEWLYSQGKGRHFHSGQHQELCEYLASTCPLTADALETDEQRKLRLILNKAQQHQQQLKDFAPQRPKLQSPRMQSRIATRHMGRSPDRLTSSYHCGISKSNSPSHQMSSSCSGDLPGTPQIMSQSFDSPGLIYTPDKKDSLREKISQDQTPKLVNQSLEAASKMVPVPESLMSPDYQDPMFDIQRSIPKSSISSQSSSCSLQEKHSNHSVSSIGKKVGSPKMTKSATSSPRLRSKAERKNSTSSVKNEEKQMNGVARSEEKDKSDSEKLDIIKLASNQRRQKKMSVESMAAVTIQKMWRGYRSRNLNKDTLRILHAIQAARARQHIQRLTCDMEATKAALDSERKIQQLQMQAINALWKKVSTLQTTESQKKNSDGSDENTEVLRQLTETCISLQAQVVELQGCMQQVLKAVSGKQRAEPAATQTDIIAVTTPQEERCTWLKRPQSLLLEISAAPAPSPLPIVSPVTAPASSHASASIPAESVPNVPVTASMGTSIPVTASMGTSVPVTASMGTSVPATASMGTSVPVTASMATSVHETASGNTTVKVSTALSGQTTYSVNASAGTPIPVNATSGTTIPVTASKATGPVATSIPATVPTTASVASNASVPIPVSVAKSHTASDPLPIPAAASAIVESSTHAPDDDDDLDHEAETPNFDMLAIERTESVMEDTTITGSLETDRDQSLVTD